MTYRRSTSLIFALTLSLGLAACSSNDKDTEKMMPDDNTMMPGDGDMMPDDKSMTPVDPSTAPRATIDRFSAEAGGLFQRNETNGLPVANAAIDFDQGPFITKGFGPSGELVEYHNFDMMSTVPAPIYVLFREGESAPVAEQLNIIDVIPGEPDYNDFWQVNRVTVPANYVANTLTSLTEISSMGYDIEPTSILVNCPVVPDGSTAGKRLMEAEAGLVEGWYNGTVVSYFNFSEKALMADDPWAPVVPVSPIYVSFNINPDQDGGGPPSGFLTEDGSDQTHNVLATIPSNDSYSPLWSVNILDNGGFSEVSNLSTATDMGIVSVLVSGAALVNCPVVSVGKVPVDPVLAARATVDRFSAEAGGLFVRNETNGLPAANAAIDFDQGPFITKGFGPTGEMVEYYNFDMMPTEPAPIYVLFREGEDAPVEGQLNIIDVIPGDPGYNDFWQVTKVTVPADYLANTLTSLTDISAMGYALEPTSTLVNCPVVPFGSTAVKRLSGVANGLVEGWYDGMVVSYFNFSEKPLTTADPLAPVVPVSPIYVMFNTNPGQDGGGPPSGFLTESDSDQTHNVLATVPSDASYSPLWSVNILDNTIFSDIAGLSSVTSADPSTILVPGAALVNCPVVSVGS